MIVADTNLMLYLHVPGEFNGLARRVADRDADWVAPRHWRSEFRNALTKSVRTADPSLKLSIEQAVACAAVAERAMAGREFEVDTAAVLRHAVASGRSAYDCEFVALAEVLGVKLVTNDGPVLRSFPALTVSIEDFAAGR